MFWNLGVKRITGKIQFHADRVVRFGAGLLLGTVRAEFERQLAEQESAAAALHVASEIRRVRDRVRVIIVATVDAADVAEALDLIWSTFQKAAGEAFAG